MKIIDRKLKAWKKLSTADKALAKQILFWLCIAKIAKTILPFKKIANLLGQQTQDCHFKIIHSKSQVNTLQKIQKLLPRICANLPWHSNCLLQSFTAAQLLKKFRISYVVHFGVDLDDDKLIAHAWLCAGDITVTGGSNSDKFKNIISFTQNFTSALIAIYATFVQHFFIWKTIRKQCPRNIFVA